MRRPNSRNTGYVRQWCGANVKFRPAYWLSESSKYTLNEERTPGLNALGQCFAILCCDTCAEEDSLSLLTGHMEAVMKSD